MLIVLLALSVFIYRCNAQAGICSWCPRVVPQWPVSWAMKDSIIAQPCNSSGLLSVASLANYSLVSIDWSNDKQGDGHPGSGWVTGRPMDAESPLIQQAEQVVAANPNHRAFVYKNIVIAYPWFPSIRAKLIDPNVRYPRRPLSLAALCIYHCWSCPSMQYADWFLKFGPPPLPNNTYHVPQCDHNYSPPLCSQFWHSQDQTPGYPKGDGNCPSPNCDCGGVPCGFCEYAKSMKANLLVVHPAYHVRTQTSSTT